VSCHINCDLCWRRACSCVDACATLKMMGLLLGLSVLQECEAATDVGLRVFKKEKLSTHRRSSSLAF